MKKLFIGFIFLVFIAIAYLMFLRPSCILSKEEAKQKFSLAQSKFLHWRGGEIHYTEEGNGFPILMIHGLGGSLRNFGKITELLKDDFTIIRVDLPGFGLSDVPQMGKSEDYRKLYQDFFEFLLNSLQLDSFHIMGNSMGGWMAWELTADHPEKIRSLTLLCSAGYDTDYIKSRLAPGMRSAFVEKLLARGVPKFVSEKNIEKCFADDSRINVEQAQIANGLTNREGNLHVLLELVRQSAEPDTMKIKSIAVPTLIVWGEKDEIIPVEHAHRFARDISNSKLLIYEDCGHLPMIEKAEQFEKDFLQFVAERKAVMKK